MTTSKQENGIVERSINQIRRHSRNIVFTTNLVNNWRKYLPSVQRIQSIGVSPAQLPFDNPIQLDRGTFLPNNPMLNAQSKLIHVVRMAQENRDDEQV